MRYKIYQDTIIKRFYFKERFLFIFWSTVTHTDDFDHEYRIECNTFDEAKAYIDKEIRRKEAEKTREKFMQYYP